MIPEKQLSASIAHAINTIIEKVKFVKNIFQDINKEHGTILLVGGAVRDILLQKPFDHIQDFDFEIYNLSIDKLTLILKKYGNVDLIGKSFGVLRLHGIDVDWSLPRKDSKGRKPEVAIDQNMSYKDACGRRDLTMNAICINMLTHELIDPYNGLQDIKNKILRSPNVHFFADDPLRLLRVMQFAGRFEMKIDEQLSKVCAHMDSSKLVQERIEQEFVKLFIHSKNPSLGLIWLESIGKWDDFLPDVENKKKLYEAIDFLAHQTIVHEEKIILIWAVFFILSNQHDVKKLRSVIKKYRLHKDRQVAIMAYCQQYALAQKVEDDFSVKLLAHVLAPHATIKNICMVLDCLHENMQAKKLYEAAQKLNVLVAPIAPLLSGVDLQEYAQARALGDLLKKAYHLQLERNITCKKKLIEVVRNIEVKI